MMFPSKRSGYRVSELQVPHWHRFTMIMGLSHEFYGKMCPVGGHSSLFPSINPGQDVGPGDSSQLARPARGGPVNLHPVTGRDQSRGQARGVAG